jgi:type II secretory pathway pseudopilin PulG
MKNPQAGYTVIELIVAMSLFTAVVGVIIAFATYYFRNYSFSFEEHQMISQTQSAMTRMIREIREARTGEDGSWPIIRADDNMFVFNSDVTNDGKTDRVRYYLNGNEIMKGVIEPGDTADVYPSDRERIFTVASFINNGGLPLFTYYNGSWPADQINNPLPEGSRIAGTRYVRIFMRADVNPGTGAEPFELESSVQIRNLKDNQ